MLLPPAVRNDFGRHRFSSGFTLVELLVVIALSATLLGITFGFLRGAKQQAAIGQVRAELAVVAQALENYRREQGDYPQTADTPEKLYQALLGLIGPTGAAISGRSLLAGAQIALRDPLHPADPANSLVDPWGNAYQYVYFVRQLSSAPISRGYVLYSYGARSSMDVLPTREGVVPEVTGERGGVIFSGAGNGQNLYAQP